MKSRNRLASDSDGNVILLHIPTLFMTLLTETAAQEMTQLTVVFSVLSNIDP